MEEMGPEPLFWSVTERALLSASLLAIMIVSVVGNSLVIVVVARNRGMRTRTNMFLCSLAVADLLCSLLAMPFSLATAIRAEWIFSRTLCLATGFDKLKDGGLTHFHFSKQTASRDRLQLCLGDSGKYKEKIFVLV